MLAAGGLVPSCKTQSQSFAKSQQHQKKPSSNKNQEKAKHKKPKTKNESEDEYVGILITFKFSSNQWSCSVASSYVIPKKWGGGGRIWWLHVLGKRHFN